MKLIQNHKGKLLIGAFLLCSYVTYRLIFNDNFSDKYIGFYHD